MMVEPSQPGVGGTPSRVIAHRSRAPSWWTAALSARAEEVAVSTLPNEACGLFYTHRDRPNVQLHDFVAASSPSRCSADPRELVDFAYWIEDGGHVVVGTFHSHPNGDPRFSRLDKMLAQWSDCHLVMVREGDVWQPVWFTTDRG